MEGEKTENAITAEATLLNFITSDAHKIYGREEELSKLLEAYFRVISNDYGDDLTLQTSYRRLQVSSSPSVPSSEIVLLTGPPGIGKSSLMRRFHEKLVETTTIDYNANTAAALDVNEISTLFVDDYEKNENKKLSFSPLSLSEPPPSSIFFITGQYDQFQWNVQYSAILFALTQLCDQILSPPHSHNLSHYSTTIKNTLERESKVLTSLIPNLTSIIGIPSHEPSNVDELESNHRLKNILMSFIKCLSRKEHPLVLFLDDMQWADAASLELVKSLVGDVDLEGFLFVGSYRSVSVHDGDYDDISGRRTEQTTDNRTILDVIDEIAHEEKEEGLFVGEYSSSLNEIPSKKRKSRVTKIKLKGLTPITVNTFVSETFHRNPNETKSVSQLIQRHTGGNALFIVLLLLSLSHDSFFSQELDMIQKALEPKNSPKQILVDKITSLPDEVQNFLKMAACVGFDIDEYKLQLIVLNGASVSQEEILLEKGGVSVSTSIDKANIINKKAGKKTLKELVNIAVEEGLVRRTRRKRMWKMDPNTKNDTDSVKYSYEFVHSWVQEASYSLVPKVFRNRLHLEIGNRFLDHHENHPNDTSDDTMMLFYAVDQMNRGCGISSSSIVSPNDQLNTSINMNNDEDDKRRIDFALLNLKAGKQAVSKSCYKAASNFFKSGINHLGPKHWENYYDLSLELYNAAAETEFFCATHYDKNVRNFEHLDYMLRQVLSHVENHDEKIRATSVLVRMCGAQDKVQEAVETGFRLLANLGEKFPPSWTPMSPTIVFQMFKTEQMLQRTKNMTTTTTTTTNNNNPTDFILSLPNMTDGVKISIMKMLRSLILYSAIAKPKYLPILVFRMVQLSLRHGLCKYSAVGFSMYGLTLCCAIGQPIIGNQYGDLSLKIVKKFQAKELEAQVYSNLCLGCKPWRNGESIENLLDTLMYAYRSGMLLGDIEFGMYSIHLYLVFSLFSGKNLLWLEKRMRYYCQQMKKYHHGAMLVLTLPLWQTVLNLTSYSSRNPVELTGNITNEGQLLMHAHKEKNTKLQIIVFRNRLMLAYIYNDYVLAANMADELRKVHQNTLYIFPRCIERFYEGLTILALALMSKRNNKKSHKIKRKRRIRQIMKQISDWSLKSPSNFENKKLLLDAEYSALTNNYEKANMSYESAISTAQANGFIQEEALANERTALFHMDIGEEDDCRTYLRRAHRCYVGWGAKRKAEQLAQKVFDDS